MIWYTIEQAAERVHRKPRTIQKWVRDKRVKTRLGIDGHRYIDEESLLLAEREVRTAQRVTRFAYSLVGADSATLQSS